MADTNKKKGAGDKGASKKATQEEAPAKEPAAKVAPKAELAKAEAGAMGETPKPPAQPAHHHDAHEGAHGEHAAHGHKPDIREYMVIFAVLAVLTAIEVGITKVPGINHGLMALALVTLAVGKAAIVGLFYMHLKHETKILKLTVALPVAAPALYALVLMSEAWWRLAR